jgi:hypothetical protein
VPVIWGIDDMIYDNFGLIDRKSIKAVILLVYTNAFIVARVLSIPLINFCLLGFEVFTAVVLKSIFFWDMTPCSPFSFRFHTTLCVSRPVSSQQNSQYIWSSPLTEIRVVGYVWVM